MAAAHVIDLRKRFPSIAQIAAALQDSARGESSWHLFHATIATGLAGWTEAARETFTRLAVLPAEYNWELELRQASLDLAPLLDDLPTYRHAILERVRKARASMKLPPPPQATSDDDLARLLLA